MVCATPVPPPPGGTITDFGVMAILMTTTVPERSRTTIEVSRYPVFRRSNVAAPRLSVWNDTRKLPLASEAVSMRPLATLCA